MNKKIDLHIHTDASDGSWTVEEMVSEVAKCNIGLFAVADHDTVSNVASASKLAENKGIYFIRAVEITSKFSVHNCHILGYGIDIENRDLLNICGENKKRYANINNGQIEKVKERGANIDLDDFAAYSGGKKITSLMITEYLIEKGVFTDFNKALSFVVSSIDWNEPAFPHPEEAIRIIKKAGGIPVLAHPGSAIRGKCFTMNEIDYLIDCGIEGIECYTTYHDRKEIDLYKNYCKKRNLLITAGSDCHGPALTTRIAGFPEAYLADLNLKGIWPDEKEI